jgi:hypothetical protein
VEPRPLSPVKFPQRPGSVTPKDESTLYPVDRRAQFNAHVRAVFPDPHSQLRPSGASTLTRPSGASSLTIDYSPGSPPLSGRSEGFWCPVDSGTANNNATLPPEVAKMMVSNSSTDYYIRSDTSSVP